LIDAQQLLGSTFGSGFFLGNPIPAEFSVAKDEIDAAIDRAVAEAAAQGITGHANTPYILARIKEVTGGQSVVANRALIRSNVALGAEVAKAYQLIQQSSSGRDGQINSA
jgi:pseudouridine-5'-phosphate glycosidase/pseudouridine kinase